MQKCLEFRDHAHACRALAAKAVHDEQRAQLEALAITWDTLAEQRAKLLRCCRPLHAA